MINYDITQTLDRIPREDWQHLCAQHPTLNYDFLKAMHDSGSVSARTGWGMLYLTAWSDDHCVGAIPCYLKSHSYGEYVFDWAWAEAYEQLGQPYYPKLLVAVPFTPVTGPRILGRDTSIKEKLVERLLALEQEAKLSSTHCLFPQEEDAKLLSRKGFLVREGVQFHWRNNGYRDFDDFLASMNHDKRKKIKQERKKIQEHQISFSWLTGSAIKEEHWQFFAQCYRQTYRQHVSTPYLNEDFFNRFFDIGLPNCCLIVAYQNNQMIACALNLFNQERAYGRYWGAMTFIPGLHFETCYYQSIAFCIAHNIPIFEGGAQGEHKLARGLTPVRTQSYHHVREPQFHRAVEDFLIREGRQIEHYRSELNEHAPFKKSD
ncbi:MAG: N-acetyltransferase [Betaproteobacteria bacterium]|nr:GNAT family N-acetyltransferase [Betaproteobacteria bacterium]MDE2422736.1 N-acetyltransferase [Betaproteobacteria bacterium]